MQQFGLFLFNLIRDDNIKMYHWYRSLVLSVLLSPYGIPMVGAAVIAFLEGINRKIRLF